MIAQALLRAFQPRARAGGRHTKECEAIVCTHVRAYVCVHMHAEGGVMHAGGERWRTKECEAVSRTYVCM